MFKSKRNNQPQELPKNLQEMFNTIAEDRQKLRKALTNNSTAYDDLEPPADEDTLEDVEEIIRDETDDLHF